MRFEVSVLALPPVVELAGVRRVGAGARDRHRGRPGGKAQHLAPAGLVEVPEPGPGRGAQQVPLAEGVQRGRAEGVTGADRVRDLDPQRRQVEPLAAVNSDTPSPPRVTTTAAGPRPSRSAAASSRETPGRRPSRSSSEAFTTSLTPTRRSIRATTSGAGAADRRPQVDVVAHRRDVPQPGRPRRRRPRTRAGAPRRSSRRAPRPGPRRPGSRTGLSRQSRSKA